MKSIGVLFFSIFLLTISAAAQPYCSLTPPDCSGWGDINFVACNGLDDNNPAINDFNALQDAFCCLRDLGGTLVFPADGLCTHGQEITIKKGKPFHIDGNGAILKNVSGASVAVGGYAGIRIQETQNFSIRNLILDGNRDARSSGGNTIVETVNHLILLRGVKDVELENVRAINSVADGFYLRSLNPTAAEQDLQRVRCIGCSSDNSWRHGLAVAAGEDIQILGGTFANANGAIDDSTGKYFSGGIRLEPNPYDPETGGNPYDAVTDILIQGVHIHDNEAMGIHIFEPLDQPVENIRILGNSLSANIRGQMLLHGKGILVANNRLEDFTYDANISEIAGILVNIGAKDVVLEGNLFSNFTTLVLDVIYARALVEGFTVRGNYFRDMLSPFERTGFSASDPAIIRTDSADSVISGNTFYSSDLRGVFIAPTATKSVVSDNAFFDMAHNVIYVDGEDTTLTGNRIANPRGSAGSGKAESVVRVLSDLGTAEGNAIACASSSQRGYLFEKNPVLVRDNVAKDCDPTLWLTVEGTSTTHGIPDNHPYP